MCFLRVKQNGVVDPRNGMEHPQEKQLTKVHGPLFGNYLDSMLERAVQTELACTVRKLICFSFLHCLN
jgi:hypothetical protein